MEQGLYAQVVMIRQRESDDKSKNKRPRNITSKENQQDQDVGLHLIMSGQNKTSGHKNNIFI